MVAVIDRPQAASHVVCWHEAGELFSAGPGNLDHGAGFVPWFVPIGANWQFSFLAPRDALETLLVKIGTCCRVNRGVLQGRIAGADGAVLACAAVALDTLADNEFHAVFDLRGVGFVAGATYDVTLWVEADPGNEIALYAAASIVQAAVSIPRRGAPGMAAARSGGAHNQGGMAPDPHLVGLLLRDEAVYRSARLVRGDTVLVCTHALPPGGAERQWIYLAMGLKQLGYRVHFAVYEDLHAEAGGRNAHYLPLLQAAGIPIHHMIHEPASALQGLLEKDAAFAALFGAHVLPNPGRLARMVRNFRAVAPKIVFAQLDEPNLYAGFAALLAGVPRVVLSFRNYNPTHFPHIHQDWYLAAYRLLAQSGRVLFSGNCAGANRDYEAWIGLAPHRAGTIANAVVPEHFARPAAGKIAACRAALGVAGDHKMVLGVFRLTQQKNPAAFVDVCARLAAELPVRGFIVGSGALLQSLQDQVKARGLDEIVRFLGRREDVSTLMAAADLLLLTSDREGMPNVVLEAQLMGLPVVATDTGATRQAMLPDVTGRICAAGDIGALVEACAGILQQPDVAARMGEAGARHVRDSFGVRRMAERYVALGQSFSGGPVTARRVLLGRADDVGADEETAFFKTIRTGDGVWKTTAARRMDDVNSLFAALYRGPRSPAIMDVGASSGISTLEWREDLVARGYRPKMTATDILVDGVLHRIGPAHYVLTDRTGRVLHAERDGRVFAPEECACLQPLRIGRLAALRGGVKLISPRARGKIRFLEDDMFAPNRKAFLGRFDVVRAANVLNLGYFPEEKLRAAVLNLKPRLRGKGAMFIVNRTLADGANHASFFALDAGGRFCVVGRVGDGSEVERIVLDS